jgi:myosin heavy subunit
MICKETYPRWSGSNKEGCQLILKLHNIGGDEIRFGKTKVFLRSPKTVGKVSYTSLIRLVFCFALLTTEINGSMIVVAISCFT